MTTLIGLGGRLQNGKDVVADRLVAEHGFVKIGMSDPLNEAMMKLNPVIDHDGEDFYLRYADIVNGLGYVEAKKDPEVRRLLQVFGTEVVREMFGNNTWVDLAYDRVTGLWSEGKRVVLTGIRFDNELNLINDLEGETWWVERPGFPVGTTNSHASEDTLTKEDFRTVLYNTKTIESLELLTDRLVNDSEWA